jgi:hypothetical protein
LVLWPRLHMQKLSTETAHTFCLEKEDSITPSKVGIQGSMPRTLPGLPLARL